MARKLSVAIVSLLFFAFLAPLGDGVLRQLTLREDPRTLVVGLEDGRPRLAFWHGEYSVGLQWYPLMALAWYSGRLSRART